MSMCTYPLEEKAALVIGAKLSAAVILGDAYKNDRASLPEKLAALLDAGTPAWRIAEGREFEPWFRENGFYNASDAYDVLSGADVQNLVHCSEFIGSGQPAGGFEDVPSSLAASDEWDDDFICLVTPEKSGTLFRAAYDSPADLVREYEEKLAPFIGPGFDYAGRIMDVCGTYYA